MIEALGEINKLKKKGLVNLKLANKKLLNNILGRFSNEKTPLDK